MGGRIHPIASVFVKLKMFLEKMKIENNDQTKALNPADLVILTFILFGKAIFYSTIIFINREYEDNDDLLYFTDYDNYYALAVQFASLCVAVIYLIFVRRFDWSTLRWGVTFRNTALGFALYIWLSFMCDFVSFAYDLTIGAPDTWSTADWVKFIEFSMRLSTFVYAAFNGFYEEVILLGLFLSVRSQHWWGAVVASLVVRWSFHLYQGLLNSFLITLTGFVILILYLRWRVLWPFIVAHAIADIFGLSLVGPAIFLLSLIGVEAS